MLLLPANISSAPPMVWVRISWIGEPEEDEVRQMELPDFYVVRSELSGQATVQIVKETPCFQCIHWNGYRWGCELGPNVPCCRQGAWDDYLPWLPPGADIPL